MAISDFGEELGLANQTPSASNPPDTGCEKVMARTENARLEWNPGSYR
jgi:hypothetical protein